MVKMMINNELEEYEEIEKNDCNADDISQTEIVEMGNEIDEIVDEATLDDIHVLDKNSDVEELEDIILEDTDSEKTGLIRDLLDQNVNEQRLPADARVEWTDEEKRGNSDCAPKDDAEFVVRFKSNGEKRAYTGEEFKSYLHDKYGKDHVTYLHNEPDFKSFEHSIDKDEFEQFLFNKYGRHIEILDVPEGHVEVEHMDANRSDTYKAACDYFLEVLGDKVSKEDLDEYMKCKDLTWHECGDRKTIRMIPTEINQFFSHTGGIGIEKDFETFITEFGDVISDENEVKRGFVLDKTPMTRTTEGLEEAIKFRHKKYKQKKKELF